MTRTAPTSAPTARVEPLLDAGPVLLYDGECGVCNRSVQWILAHERESTLRFAPLESEIGRSLTRCAQVPGEVDSLLWIETKDHAVVARKWSDSVVATLEYVGGPWRLLAVIRFIPRPIRDFLYKAFARRRLQVASPTCLVPPAESRSRFLDA